MPVRSTRVDTSTPAGIQRCKSGISARTRSTVSISLSLVAAFTPLIFMDGIVGRLLREFSLTLTFAILVSTLVSLTTTPMVCAHYVKTATSDRETWFDRIIEGSLTRVVAFYTRTLRAVLDFPLLTMVVFCATIALTVTLYIKTPKGYFPVDDSGFVIGSTRASPDISFQAMLELQQRMADIVMADRRSPASARSSAAPPTAARCSSP